MRTPLGSTWALVGLIGGLLVSSHLLHTGFLSLHRDLMSSRSHVVRDKKHIFGIARQWHWQPQAQNTVSRFTNAPLCTLSLLFGRSITRGLGLCSVWVVVWGSWLLGGFGLFVLRCVWVGRLLGKLCRFQRVRVNPLVHSATVSPTPKANDA